MGEVVYTSPHLFPCFTDAFKGKKQATELPQKVEWGELQCTGSSSSYLTKLRASRAALVESLSTLSSDPAHLDAQLEDYLSLACPLLPQLAIQLQTGMPASSGEAADAPPGNEMDVREGVEGLQGNGEAAGNLGAAGGNSNVSRMPAEAYHGLGMFTWRNQLLSLQDSCWSSCGGVAMDVGYLLLHTALWRWAKATHVVQQHGKRVPPDPVLQAFRLLRYAAGALCTLRTVLLPATATALASPHADAEAQKHHIQPTSGDLSPHVLEALQAACFADAQSLSLLRASNKENAYQSAGLIASIAHDTAGLYATALLRIDTFASSKPTPGNTLSPSILAPPNGGAIASCNKDVSGHGIGAYAGVPRELGAYCRYKYAVCHTYALTFSALTGLHQEAKAGWAVRVAQEAVAWEEKTVKKLGAESDKSTKHKESERAAFDADLASQSQRALTKLHRDNDGVYYKRVPAQMPDQGEVLPQGCRVVEASPLTLPTKPPVPFTLDDVSRLLEDSILASAKHKSDSHPLPTPPAPAATAAGEIAEAHTDSAEAQQGEDREGQGKQATAAAPEKPHEQQAPAKKAQQGCCSVQ